jgi:hypothetical protein
MVRARLADIVGRSALAILQLFGGAFVLFGMLGSVFRWLFPSRILHSHWHMVLSVVIFFCAAIAGLGVVYRYRWAAIVLSGWFGFLGVLQTYGMIHGFFLPHPPNFSPVQIGGVATFALLPALVTVIAWKRLRWR